MKTDIVAFHQIGHALGEIPRPTSSANTAVADATVPAAGAHSISGAFEPHQPAPDLSTNFDDAHSRYLTSHNATPLFPIPPSVPSQRTLHKVPTRPIFPNLDRHEDQFAAAARKVPRRDNTPPASGKTLKRDSSEVVSPTSTSAPKPRKVKRTMGKARDSSDDEVGSEVVAAEFELVIHVHRPPKPTATSAGRRKMSAKPAKVEPVIFGPAASNTDASWKDFLRILAELLDTTTALLATHSFQWKYLKPGNCPWLPLGNENAYRSLTRQLREPPKNVSGSYIVVKMDAPVQKPVDRSKVWFSLSQISTLKLITELESLGPFRMLKTKLDGLMMRMMKTLMMLAKERRYFLSFKLNAP
jgi:hypothetical protein